MPQMKINTSMSLPANCTKYWVKGGTAINIAEIVMEQNYLNLQVVPGEVSN